MKITVFIILLIPFQFSFAQDLTGVKKETLIMPGFQALHTPREYNQTGYVRYYLESSISKRKTILVLVSGFISGPSWFEKIARQMVSKGNMEIWVMIRRQSFLENRKKFISDIQEFLKDPVPENPLLKKINQTAFYLPEDLSFTAHWGLNAQIMDLKLVIEAAKKRSVNVFLGGWSDGVEYAMLYSAKCFENGQSGSQDILGLILLDENPEWGTVSDFKSRKQIQKNLIAAKSYYFTYTPSLPLYSLALYLANHAPNDLSPLAYLFQIPASVKEKGISNRALIGWIFEAGMNYQNRGPFSYYVYSGHLDKNIPLGWENDIHKNTKIDDLIELEKNSGALFEWCYPRKIIQDYWEIGECGFSSCSHHQIKPFKKNDLKIFYILSGKNAGKSLPQGLKWFLGTSGILTKQVTYFPFPEYGHADCLLSKDANRKLYQPLYDWLMKNSTHE